MALIPELWPLVTEVVVTGLHRGCTIAVITPITDSIATYTLRIIGEAEECIQAHITTRCSPIVRSLSTACSNLTTRRTVHISDTTIDIQCKWNLENRIITVVYLVVTLVNKYIIPVFCQSVCTSLHDRVAICTCNLIILLVVACTTHGSYTAGITGIRMQGITATEEWHTCDQCPSKLLGTTLDALGNLIWHLHRRSGVTKIIDNSSKDSLTINDRHN